jgi:arginase
MEEKVKLEMTLWTYQFRQARVPQGTLENSPAFRRREGRHGMVPIRRTAAMPAARVGGPFQACLRHAHRLIAPIRHRKWRAMVSGPFGTSRLVKTMAPATASSSSIVPKKIRVIGVPLDLGQSRRGVDMGPSAVRVAGLEARLEALGHVVEDAGNVSVAIAEQKTEGDPRAKYLKEITATCTKHAELVIRTLESAIVPMVLGGDHSVAAGTVAGVAEFYRRQNQKIGLIWIDAHPDINTPESSPSGNVHGMPLAATMGLGPPELADIFNFSPKVKPENCVLVGVRDIDAIEKENVRRAGIGVFTMRDIDERGMRTVMEEALRIAGRGTAGYHVSLDMDWIDPEDAPGVGTPVRGGATYREAHLAMEIIADHGRMLSFEIVEVNPVIDEHNRTADLAVELALSAFGKKIL